MDLSGRTAVVTGGAAGIGMGLARALSARGAKVVIADIDGPAAEAAARALNSRAIVCDVSARASIDAMFDDVWAREGPVDLVCSNAGVGRNKRVLNEKPEEIEALFRVNYLSALHMVQAYLPRIEAGGRRGRILFTASENSFSAPQAVQAFGLGDYGGTKHALLILIEWLRIELNGRPLDLHLLCPGGVLTERFAARFPDPSHIPPNMNFITPDQCAAIALQGLDLCLFYIPTHAHIADDMRPRLEELARSFAALGLRS
jgi:NAD(P)-dependent dehydrogenase (short-subunit alcohol dehydrogenase family)